MLPAACFLLLAAAPPPQDADGCRKCGHQGVLDCKEHEPEERAWEAEVLRCSVLARCPACAGALLVDCPKCEGGPGSTLLAERRDAAAIWLAREDPLEALLKRPLPRAESAHFRIVADTPSLKDGKKKVDGHAFLHLLARDLERTGALLDGHHGATAADRRTPARLWLWQKQEDHAAVMRQFLFSTSAGDFKVLGKEPVCSAWTGDEQFQDSAPALHSLAVHNGAHMLLSNLFRELWIGDLDAGWLDEGSAHWYEERVIGRSVNFCVDETGIPDGGTPVLSRAAVRARLARDDAPVLPGMLRRQTGELSADQHVCAWSFYDWLAQRQPAALAALLRGAQARRPPSELFPEALSMTVFQAEEAWRAYVAETYPAREPVPKR